MRSDEQLMQAYQEGDERAFECLHRRYSGRMAAYFKQRAPFLDSEELVQGVFLKLHRARHRYHSKLLFGPWLFTICRNHLIDVLRGQKQEVEWDDQQLGSNGGDGAEGPADVPIEKLNISHREAIELRYYQQLSFEQMAHRLHISPQAARKRVNRAIHVLRSFFHGGVYEK